MSSNLNWLVVLSYSYIDGLVRYLDEVFDCDARQADDMGSSYPVIALSADRVLAKQGNAFEELVLTHPRYRSEPLLLSDYRQVAGNFEGLVVRADDRLWKVVRTFDDPGTWTEPGVRQLAYTGSGAQRYRSDVLDDQWELYDLTADPVESANRWTDPELAELRDHLRSTLATTRAGSVPDRNDPWPYAERRPTAGPPAKSPSDGRGTSVVSGPPAARQAASPPSSSRTSGWPWCRSSHQHRAAAWPAATCC